MSSRILPRVQVNSPFQSYVTPTGNIIYNTPPLSLYWNQVPPQSTTTVAPVSDPTAAPAGSTSMWLYIGIALAAFVLLKKK
jgi:hypothetical protein